MSSSASSVSCGMPSLIIDEPDELAGRGVVDGPHPGTGLRVGDRVLEVADHRAEVALLAGPAPEAHHGLDVVLGDDVAELDDRHQVGASGRPATGRARARISSRNASERGVALEGVAGGSRASRSRPRAPSRRRSAERRRAPRRPGAGRPSGASAPRGVRPARSCGGPGQRSHRTPPSGGTQRNALVGLEEPVALDAAIDLGPDAELVGEVHLEPAGDPARAPSRRRAARRRACRSR